MATNMHLEAGGVNESERGDGEPGLPAGGLLPAARGGEGDEQRARGEQAQRGDEERARAGNDPLHGHHSRAPEEEGRHQGRRLPELPPRGGSRDRSVALALPIVFGRAAGKEGSCVFSAGVDEALDV